MADGSTSNRFVLKQPFHDLGAHFAVQAVDGLGGRVACHAQDALGVGLDQLAGAVDVEENLRAAEYEPYGQRGQQDDAQ